MSELQARYWDGSGRDPSINKEEKMRQIMKEQINRRDIFYADLEPVIGSEQGGERPVLILQNDKGNQSSMTVVVAAITSKTDKKTGAIHVLLSSGNLRVESMVLLEQLRTLDKSRLSDYIGTVNESDMKKVERALKKCLGLYHDKNRMPYQDQDTTEV